MKVKLTFVMFVMVFALGCQSFRGLIGMATSMTPAQEYAAAVIAYTYAVETALDLHDAGRITDDQFLKFDEYRQHVDRALGLWEMALESGLSAEGAKGLYNRAMARLNESLPSEEEDDGS